MVKIKKQASVYASPGTIRARPKPEHIRKIVTHYGVQWFLNTLLDNICYETKISKTSVLSRSKKGNIPIVRHLFRYYGWELLNPFISLNKVNFFISDGRSNDHATVIRSRELIRNSLEADDTWGRKVRKYMYNIDFKINQIGINYESDSTNG